MKDKKRPFLIAKRSRKELDSISRECVEGVRSLSADGEAWNRITLEMADPLERLIANVVDLIKGFGYSIPQNSEEKTPAELRLREFFRDQSREGIDFSVAPDARGVELLASTFPYIVEATHDTQTSLWVAYRCLREAKAARDATNIADAMVSLIEGTTCLVLGTTGAIADMRRSAAVESATAGHAAHNNNKQKARDWYAAHSTMTKDAAAEKMANDRIVHASFRTIRGYLTGQ